MALTLDTKDIVKIIWSRLITKLIILGFLVWSHKFCMTIDNPFVRKISTTFSWFMYGLLYGFFG